MSFAELITPLDKANGPGHYTVTYHYRESGRVEACSLRIDDPKQFTHGGGGLRKNAARTEMDLLTLQKSIQRSRSTVKRLCHALGADRLLTLTYRENISDSKLAWSHFKVFVKSMHKRFPHFAYIAVQELQARGAIHFHLAIRGFYSVTAIRVLWLKAIKKYSDGNIDISYSKARQSKTTDAIAGYISKYITHDIEAGEFNKRRYSSGGDISKPDKQIYWLSVGAPVSLVLRDLIHEMTGRENRLKYYDSPDHFYLYVTTT